MTARHDGDDPGRRRARRGHGKATAAAAVEDTIGRSGRVGSGQRPWTIDSLWSADEQAHEQVDEQAGVCPRDLYEGYTSTSAAAARPSRPAFPTEGEVR